MLSPFVEGRYYDFQATGAVNDQRATTGASRKPPEARSQTSKRWLADPQERTLAATIAAAIIAGLLIALV